MRKTLVFPALALIAGCGYGQNDPGPGGVTNREAKALDEAAAILESRQPPADLTASQTPEAGATEPDPKGP